MMLFTALAAATLVTTAPPATAAPATAGHAGPAAHPVTIGCGQVILTDAILAADLTCGNSPVVAGADGITLDLRGHTLSGTGIGISVSRANVTVRDGTIRGVRLFTSSAVGLTLRRLTVAAGASVDPGAEGVRGIAIFDSTFGAGTSLSLTGCKICPIQHTAFTGASIGANDNTSGIIISKNSTFVDSPIHFTEAGAISIFDSRFSNSPVNFRVSSGLILSGNTFSNATVGVGIDLGFGGAAFQFIGNTFADNGIGLNISDPFGPVTVANNTFVRNGAAGLRLVTVQQSGLATTIAANEFRRNGFASGGRLDATGRAVNDGLHIDFTTGTGVTIAANHTTHNADYGIEAPPTVTDGGGNHSSGDPSGCLGVTCG